MVCVCACVCVCVHACVRVCVCVCVCVCPSHGDNVHTVCTMCFLSCVMYRTVSVVCLQLRDVCVVLYCVDLYSC